MLFIAILTGCKKDDTAGVEVDPISDPNAIPLSLSDSIYFEIDGKPYISNNAFSTSIANSGVHMKLSDVLMQGRKDWGMIAGKHYTSSADSIYMSYGRTFVSSGNYGNLDISFGKGFHVKDLNQIGALWYTKDVRNILEKGKQEFAIDYQSTNSIDGVFFDIAGLGRTGKPEYSFGGSSGNYQQNDAHFEITKKEQVDKNRYRIFASFEMNLYEANGKQRRATKGFLRLTVYSDFFQVDLFSGTSTFGKTPK